jgi:hypothetical protein
LSFGLFAETTPVFRPSQCMRPRYRACSIFMQRSITTSSPPARAISAPSGLTTLNCSQSARAPTCTACRAISGTALGARKTSTTSIGSGTSSRLG